MVGTLQPFIAKLGDDESFDSATIGLTSGAWA